MARGVRCRCLLVDCLKRRRLKGSQCDTWMDNCKGLEIEPFPKISADSGHHNACTAMSGTLDEEHCGDLDNECKLRPNKKGAGWFCPVIVRACYIAQDRGVPGCPVQRAQVIATIIAADLTDTWAAAACDGTTSGKCDAQFFTDGRGNVLVTRSGNDATRTEIQRPTFTYPIVARFHGCFRTKFGAPRQGALTPAARGVVILEQWLSAEFLEGLSEYSHCWLIWAFHESGQTAQRPFVRPPKYGGERVGIFASRSPHRPSNIGVSAVRVRGVQDRCLFVSAFDLIDGTPILDVKPYHPLDAVAGARFPQRLTAAFASALAAVRFSPAFEDQIRAAVQGASEELDTPGGARSDTNGPADFSDSASDSSSEIFGDDSREKIRNICQRWASHTGAISLGFSNQDSSIRDPPNQQHGGPHASGSTVLSAPCLNRLSCSQRRKSRAGTVNKFGGRAPFQFLRSARQFRQLVRELLLCDPRTQRDSHAERQADKEHVVFVDNFDVFYTVENKVAVVQRAVLRKAATEN